MLACEHGVAGLVVSNHGGRQLDGVSATLDALPEVVEAVSGRAEVYLDGGVRRGTDAVKALALGAKSVFVGRPALWGLAGAAFCCLILASSSWLTQSQYTIRPAGVIVAEEVVVRKGNGESYTPQLPQPLHAGTEFVVREARGSWLAIELDNGTSGWIRRDSAALL